MPLDGCQVPHEGVRCPLRGVRCPLRITGVRSPKSATTHKNIDTDYDMVISARRVFLVQIVDTLGLSYGTVNTSLHS